VRLLETRFLVTAGLVSYSIFLWQVPVIVWAREHGLTLAGPPGVVVNLALLGALVFVLSVFSYRFVEHPALSHKGKAKPAKGVGSRAHTAAPSPS
jgi:peptidoglycan/LPS O-acetylase OafA/YrhL